MQKNTKIIASLALALAAGAMYGCGSSGGGSDFVGGGTTTTTAAATTTTTGATTTTTTGATTTTTTGATTTTTTGATTTTTTTTTLPSGTVTVNAANTTPNDAALGVMTYNVTPGNYTYAISNLANGDKIVCNGVTSSVTNTAVDGNLTVKCSSASETATINLTGINTTVDGTIFSKPTFITAFPGSVLP